MEPHLSSVVRSEIEWRTVALGENSLSVLPGETVLSVLLRLTLSLLLAHGWFEPALATPVLLGVLTVGQLEVDVDVFGTESSVEPHHHVGDPGPADVVTLVLKTPGQCSVR